MENYTRTQMQKSMILQRLKEDGCRITKQRKILLDIILNDECTCCKEIYYRASKKDPKIGAATVYRMVNTLEEIGAINRKNLYKVDCRECCPDGCQSMEICRIELDDNTTLELNKNRWHEIVQLGLKAYGLSHGQKIRSVEMA